MKFYCIGCKNQYINLKNLYQLTTCIKVLSTLSIILRIDFMISIMS